MQGIFSTIFFLAGSYLVSYLPRMVPSYLLCWVGIELAALGLWDSRPKFEILDDQRHRRREFSSKRERTSFDVKDYLVVVMMVMIGIANDSGMMMVIGLFFSFLLTLQRLHTLDVSSMSCDLTAITSDVLRPAYLSQLLRVYGNRTFVTKLARGYLSFHNAGSLLELIEKVLHNAESPIEHVIIDFAKVKGVSLDAAQIITELLGLATEHKFHMIFTSLDNVVEQQLRQFGLCLASLKVVDDSEYGARIYVPVSAQVGHYHIGTLNSAVEYVESELIKRYPTGTSKVGLEPGDMHTDMKQGLEELSELASTQGTTWAPGAYQGLYGEMHVWLKPCLETTYNPLALKSLHTYVKIKTGSPGHIIYDSTNFTPEMMSYSGGYTEYPTPPLIWLLSGRIEHVWTGADKPCPFLKKIAKGHGLEMNCEHREGEEDHDGGHKRIESAEIPFDSDSHDCTGPFQTFTGFFGMMPHQGTLTCAGESRTTYAILTRAEYDRMLKREPLLANLFMIYVSRKRYADTGTMVHHERYAPKLLV